MSGRSESNSLFHSNGGEMLTRRADEKLIGAAPAYQHLLDKYDEDYIENIICETRQNWINNYRELLTIITIPKILFWFSERDIPYKRKHKNVYTLFGEFPQFVDDEWMNKMIPYADDYTVCITKRGMPQQLYSRLSGKKASIKMRKDLGGKKKVVNDYYPSPEIHADAIALLEPVCRSMLSSI